MQSLSLLNPFRQENVGILDGFGILCFTQLHLVEKFLYVGDSSTDLVNIVTISCFNAFLKDVLVKEYSSWFIATAGLHELMDAADASLPPHKEIIFIPELMSDELHATLLLQMQRVVRKQLPTRGLNTKAMGIMEDVHNSTGGGAKEIYSGRDFLRQWACAHFSITGTGLSALSKKEKKLYKNFFKKMKKGLPSNILPVASMKSDLAKGLIFDVHRHSLAHTVVPQIDKIIADLSHNNTLATDPKLSGILSFCCAT